MNFISQMLDVGFDLNKQTLRLLHIDPRVVAASFLFLQLVFFYFYGSLSPFIIRENSNSSRKLI